MITEDMLRNVKKSEGKERGNVPFEGWSLVAPPKAKTTRQKREKSAPTI